MLLLQQLGTILVLGLAAFAQGLNYDEAQHCYQDLLVSSTDLILLKSDTDTFGLGLILTQPAFGSRSVPLQI